MAAKLVFSFFFSFGLDLVCTLPEAPPRSRTPTRRPVFFFFFGFDLYAVGGSPTESDADSQTSSSFFGFFPLDFWIFGFYFLDFLDFWILFFGFFGFILISIMGQL